MAWTQTQLDAIENAIAGGTLRVEFFDKVVVYRSLDEMMRVRDLIRSELGITDGTTKRILSEYDKGL